MTNLLCSTRSQRELCRFKKKEKYIERVKRSSPKKGKENIICKGMVAYEMRNEGRFRPISARIRTKWASLRQGW
jgi:hypothetical protein